MKANNRVIRFLDFAGPGGATLTDISIVCHIGQTELRVMLKRMEIAGKIASGQICTGSPLYYRLAEYPSTHR